jgi:hypothetical protein
MANRVRPIVVSEADRHELERLGRGSSTPARLSRRARAVLLMAQGVAGVEIATRTSYTVVQISRLRRHDTERLSDRRVVEVDAPWPVRPGEHADGEEDEEHRHARSSRRPAGDDAEQ